MSLSFRNASFENNHAPPTAPKLPNCLPGPKREEPSLRPVRFMIYLSSHLKLSLPKTAWYLYSDAPSEITETFSAADKFKIWLLLGKLPPVSPRSFDCWCWKVAPTRALKRPLPHFFCQCSCGSIIQERREVLLILTPDLALVLVAVVGPK